MAPAAWPAPDMPPAPLAGEVERMVAELLAGDAAKLKLKAAGQRVAFEGLAWDAGQGRAAGTSAFGLRLNQAVDSALARRRIGARAAADLPTRGIGGAILKGAFSSVGSTVGVVMSLVDANSGRIVSEVKRRLSPAALTGLGMDKLLPPSSSDAKLLAGLVQGAIGAGPQPFELHVRTERGANAAYFESDHLQVVVQADRDCHLRLYHVSWTDKRLTLIFPNRSEPESRIPGGVPVKVPADGSAAVFEVARPYGVDAIVAIASEEPFEDAASVAAALARSPEPAPPSVVDAGLEPAPEPAPETGPDATVAEPDPASDVPASDPPVAEEETEGATLSGEFLTEPGIDEARTRTVLTRGLIVRHRTDASLGTEAPPGFSATAGIASTTPGRLARAVCFFTTLPKLTFSRP